MPHISSPGHLMLDRLNQLKAQIMAQVVTPGVESFKKLIQTSMLSEFLISQARRILTELEQQEEYNFNGQLHHPYEKEAVDFTYDVVELMAKYRDMSYKVYKKLGLTPPNDSDWEQFAKIDIQYANKLLDRLEQQLVAPVEESQFIDDFHSAYLIWRGLTLEQINELLLNKGRVPQTCIRLIDMFSHDVVAQSEHLDPLPEISDIDEAILILKQGRLQRIPQENAHVLLHQYLPLVQMGTKIIDLTKTLSSKYKEMMENIRKQYECVGILYRDFLLDDGAYHQTPDDEFNSSYESGESTAIVQKLICLGHEFRILKQLSKFSMQPMESDNLNRFYQPYRETERFDEIPLPSIIIKYNTLHGKMNLVNCIDKETNESANVKLCITIEVSNKRIAEQPAWFESLLQAYTRIRPACKYSSDTGYIADGLKPVALATYLNRFLTELMPLVTNFEEVSLQISEQLETVLSKNLPMSALSHS